MSTKTLDFSIGGIAFSLSRFANADYPRIQADSLPLGRSASGVVNLGGSFHEPPHLWDIAAYCTLEQEKLIKLIWAEFDARRRANQTVEIRLADKTQLFEERLPRTRAIASGTTQENYPDTNPTHCLYYAQFNVVPLERPKFNLHGPHDRILTWTLQEGSKVTA